ncbi:MAG: hypothetical protein AAF489_03670 [Bacteroidota bacterium]
MKIWKLTQKIGQWFQSKFKRKSDHSLKTIREKQDLLNARLDKLDEMEQKLKDSIK